MKNNFKIILDKQKKEAYSSLMLKLNSEKIKRALKRKGIPVTAIADRWGCSVQNVYEILDRRPVQQADRFAEILNIRAERLIVNE